MTKKQFIALCFQHGISASYSGNQKAMYMYGSQPQLNNLFDAIKGPTPRKQPYYWDKVAFKLMPQATS